MAKFVAKSISSSLKKPARQAVGYWKQPVFRDKLFISFSLSNVALTVAIVLILVFNIHPRDFLVPIQYSTLHGFDALGAWYRVYAFGVFSILVTFGNSYLASVSYRRSRMLSFFLVFGATVVNLITLVVVYTLVSNLGL